MLLRQIQHFQAIVEEKSFTRAALACYISQSAISQSLKSLEEELGVKLLERHGRTFTLTESGQYFYEKTTALTADLESVCRETVRLARQGIEQLHLGVLSAYSGDEFNRAVAAFSQKHPDVEISATVGSHEDLYDGLRFGKIDLALSDQRRAFSGAYENRVLTEQPVFVELSARNPLSNQSGVSVEDLKDTPCILLASKEQQDEERRYYRDILGFPSGEFLFVPDLQTARILVVSNRGVLPIEGTGRQAPSPAAIKRLPLLRGGGALLRRYCAFWKKSNTSQNLEEFAQILGSMF